MNSLLLSKETSLLYHTISRICVSDGDYLDGNVLLDRNNFTYPISTCNYFSFYNTSTKTTIQGSPLLTTNSISYDFCGTTSLEGSPLVVSGSLSCSGSKITNLIGAPLYISGSFDCVCSHLTSLEGMPLYIGGQLYCYRKIGDTVFNEHLMRDYLTNMGCIVRGLIILCS